MFEFLFDLIVFLFSVHMSHLDENRWTSIKLFLLENSTWTLCFIYVLKSKKLRKH